MNIRVPITSTDTRLAESAARLRFAIVRTARRLRQEAAGTGTELSPTAASTLATVERHGPLTPSELAEIERIKRPTATRTLRVLEEAGLVDREELPPPIARTVYTLSDKGWHKVLPVVKAIATFGLEMVVPDASALTPLNGFLAGILLAFDPATAGDLHASYRIEIDDRRFEFAVDRAGLTAAQDAPAVTLTATAADLIAARMGTTAAERKAALRRVKFDGDAGAVDEMRRVFALSGDPGLQAA